LFEQFITGKFVGRAIKTNEEMLGKYK